MMVNLTQTPELIEADLQIMEAMAAEMPHYLKYDGLYYPLSHANYPRLTLGNYLMRQHRLVTLINRLDDETADRLNHAMTQFQTAIQDHLVSVEQHANQELQARVKQWDIYLQEIADKPEEYAAYYATHATDRTILETIFNFMQPPYRPVPQARHDLDMLDFVLQGKWDDGGFIWPEVWQPAYPQDHYWWLYGRPAL